MPLPQPDPERPPAPALATASTAAGRQRDSRLAFPGAHDELTGYFNRGRLADFVDGECERARQHGAPAAFLLAAVDNLRLINETYGRQAGDEVLVAAGRRIAGRLPPHAVLGRVSGSKFGILLRDCDEPAMRHLAGDLIAAVRDKVIATSSGAVAGSVSIGAVAIGPYQCSANDILSRSEEALHAARAGGGGRFQAHIFSAEDESRRRATAALSAELIEALQDNRFRLALQPVVDIRSRQPQFHEALLRLERRNGDIVTATTFMPLSNSLGLSRLLDQRALELGLAALDADPDLRLSLNVTAGTTAEPAWLATLEDAAQRLPLSGRLVIEITESVAIHALDEVTAFIVAVRRLGCRVAMDDFGAGFTSFRNLRALQIDLVKIDGAFIRNIADDRDDQLFVSALVTLARNLGFETIAEWVLDERTIGVLAGLGVDAIQGDAAGPSRLLAR